MTKWSAAAVASGAGCSAANFLGLRCQCHSPAIMKNTAVTAAAKAVLNYVCCCSESATKPTHL